MTKAIINVDCYDYHHFYPRQYVLYDETILATGPMGEYDALPEKPREVLDGKGALLMPGHVNGHSHIYSAYARGLRIRHFAPQTFTQRLQQMWWPLDRRYTLEACYHSARVYGIEHIKSGVTTVVDHHAGGAIRGSLNQLKRGLVEEIGLRGLFCFETSDRYNVQDCIDENVSFARENPGNGKSRGLFGFHAALTLSEETLKKAARAQDGIPIHTHLGESVEEQYQSLNLCGRRAAQRFAHYGLLGQGALLAHCTNIDEAEAQLIAETGATAVLNPTANLNSNNGVPDAGLLKRFGVETAIGTDSMGTNVVKEYQNTYYIMQKKLDDRTTQKFSQDDLLDCIRAGYQYAGGMLGVKLGRILPGYAADLITVPYRVTTSIGEENAFAYIMGGVYTHFFPRDVVVAGQLKMRDYTTVFDEERIFADSRAVAQKVWESGEEFLV